MPYGISETAAKELEYDAPLTPLRFGPRTQPKALSLNNGTVHGIVCDWNHLMTKSSTVRMSDIAVVAGNLDKDFMDISRHLKAARQVTFNLSPQSHPANHHHSKAKSNTHHSTERALSGKRT